MQLRDNGLRFSPITLVLHWIVAALLFSIIGLGIAIALVGEVQKPEWTRVQNLLGTILFFVSIYRFWARVTSPTSTADAAQVDRGDPVTDGPALRREPGAVVRRA